MSVIHTHSLKLVSHCEHQLHRPILSPEIDVVETITGSSCNLYLWQWIGRLISKVLIIIAQVHPSFIATWAFFVSEILAISVISVISSSRETTFSFVFKIVLRYKISLLRNTNACRTRHTNNICSLVSKKCLSPKTNFLSFRFLSKKFW